jgi:hypothetical protein
VSEGRPTESDYFRAFINGLRGLIDDAEEAGYSGEATELLRAAEEVFKEHFERQSGDRAPADR